MKFNQNSIPLNKTLEIEDDVTFDASLFNPNYIRKIEKCHVLGKASRFNDILKISLSIQAEVVGVCAYSLQDVPITLKFKDELYFSKDQEDENVYLEEKDIIFLDDYILGLILDHLPSKIVKEGATLPDGGNGYRVIDEATLKKERSEKKESPFDQLDALDLD